MGEATLKGEGPVPLDEYPVHQVPMSMRHMESSDRNCYDRSYFNAHDRTGEVFLVTGLGVYPNLGVIDAFATVARGRRQHTVRFSDALGEDRTVQQVGPYRVEVEKPLERVRLVCQAASHGIAFDLTFSASFPAAEEPRHVMRQSGRIVLDAQRFAQVGTWAGTVSVDGEELAVSERWVGTRDRSWGIRPVGEPEPPGRAAAEPDPDFGFWWTYMPLRFEDFALVVIAQEDGAGERTLSEALRVWGRGSMRQVEQLGWPEIELRYRPGTRHPQGATVHLSRRGKVVTVEVDTLGYVALNCGPGYGGDPDWGHGQWRGRRWSEAVVVDLDDPAVAERVPFGVVDHVARARWDGAEGWGMFEHGTFGRHAPSGFADWGSVAP